MSSVYFLTGATGAVGAAVVPEIMKYPDAKLWLLIRAADDEHLRSRFEELLNFWDFKFQDVHDRLIPVRGDISEPCFGLETGVYDRLTESCTHIIHCAGNVRMNLPLNEARKSSLNSSENIVRLGEICQRNRRLQKIEFVSTVGVGGKMRGAVPERFITEARSFHNTYEQAKAEAEEYIKPYMDHGLPITVHRPSMVVGDAQSGKIIHFQIFYHLCEFLSGRRTMGFLPGLKGKVLDIVPVDYVSRALVWSSRNKETAGQVLHLCSGPEKAMDMQKLMHRVRKIYSSAGIKVPIPKVIPLRIFRAALPGIRLLVPAGAKRAVRALPLFLDYLGERQVFENEKSITMLQSYQAEKLWDENLVDNVLSFYLKQRYN